MFCHKPAMKPIYAPGFGLLRNSTPRQASLRLTPIYAPGGADGLPGRRGAP